MEKLSGSGISDRKIPFRWCLRDPRIDRETHAQPFYKRVLKKSKSFFFSGQSSERARQKAAIWGSGRR